MLAMKHYVKKVLDQCKSCQGSSTRNYSALCLYGRNPIYACPWSWETFV